MRASQTSKGRASHAALHLLQQRQHEREGGKAQQRHAQAEDLRRQAGGRVRQVLPEDDHQDLREPQQSFHIHSPVVTLLM